MKALLLATALATAASGAFAASRADLTDARKAEITELLTAQGYEVRQIQIEDGMYEVYAIKDGGRYEVYLADDLTVLRTKMDD